jgi:hypothetical protein
MNELYELNLFICINSQLFNIINNFLINKCIQNNYYLIMKLLKQ